MFSGGLEIAGLMAELNDLNFSSQPKQFYGSLGHKNAR